MPTIVNMQVFDYTHFSPENIGSQSKYKNSS